MYQNVSKMYQDVSRCIKDVSRCIKMYQDVSKRCIKIEIKS